MISISKNVYVNRSDVIVNKYYNTYLSLIKMKPANEHPSTYVDFGNKKIMKKKTKFKTCDHVRISKYEHIFPKGYVPNLSEEVFVIKKVENPVPWTFVISDLNDEEIVGTFCEKKLLKTNQKAIQDRT